MAARAAGTTAYSRLRATDEVKALVGVSAAAQPAGGLSAACWLYTRDRSLRSRA
jgi:hypothetical protein